MLTRPAVVFFACLLGLCGTGCARQTSAARAAHGPGAVLYAKNCSVCHTPGIGSRIGPPLEGVGRRLSTEQIVHAIDRPDPPMPKLYPSVLTGRDVRDIVAYVKTL